MKNPNHDQPAESRDAGRGRKYIKCKHEWKLLLPPSKDVSPLDKVNYIVDVMLAGPLMSRSVICERCGRTGHKINSSRGGVRLHHSNHFLIEANKILKQNGIPEHNTQTSNQ